MTRRSSPGCCVAAACACGSLRSPPASGSSSASAGGPCGGPAPLPSTWNPRGSLRAPTPSPLVTMRVVLDTQRHELIRPLRTLTGTAIAYRTLRRACALVQDWASAIAPREVVLASPRASCAGVNRAVEIVERVARDAGCARLRPQADRPQRPRGRLARGARGGVRRRARRGSGGRDRDLLRARRLAGGPRCRRPSEAWTWSTRPARSSPRSTRRRAGSRPPTSTSSSSAIRATRRSTAPIGQAPERIHVIANAAELDRVEVKDPAKVAYLTQTTLAVDDTAGVIEAIRSAVPGRGRTAVERHLLRDPEPPGCRPLAGGGV